MAKQHSHQAKVKPPKQKTGPKPYDPARTPHIIFALSAVGKTDAEIAYYLGLAPETLSRWRKKFPEVDQALKDAHRGIDMEIENALAKAALGIESTSEVVRGRMDQGKLTPTDVTKAKSTSPSVSAMIFWLKNRRPDKWRESQGLNLSGVVEGGSPTVATNLFILLPPKRKDVDGQQSPPASERG